MARFHESGSIQTRVPQSLHSVPLPDWFRLLRRRAVLLRWTPSGFQLPVLQNPVLLHFLYYSPSRLNIKAVVLMLISSDSHAVFRISRGSDRKFRRGFQEIRFIRDHASDRQPEMKPCIILHSFLHKQLPYSGSRVQESKKHQRFSCPPLDRYVVDQDFCFYKHKGTVPVSRISKHC